MKNLFSLLASVCFFLFTSGQVVNSKTDSIEYYNNELILLNKAYNESLTNSPEFISLNQNLKRLSVASDNYKALAIYTGIFSADMDKFNADNALSNFPAISGPMLSFGFGYSFKKNRRIFDMNIVAIPLGKKSAIENEYIKTHMSALFQFEWGYDFIKNNAVNIYPYAGFGLRATNLEYKSQEQPNPGFNNLSDISTGNKSVKGDMTRLGYQAGVGLEYVLTQKNSMGGALVFFKAGTNRPFTNKPFTFEGLEYDPGFKYGEWAITAGFKIFGR